MLRRPALAALLLAALTVAGCHHRPHQPGQQPGPSGPFGPFGPPASRDPQRPQVAVVQGTLLVDQEALHFTKPGQVRITWQLPAQGGYRFTPDGIRFEPRAKGEIDCQFNAEKPLEYSCVNLNTRRGFYKYDIRVTDGRTTLLLDPFVINNWD